MSVYFHACWSGSARVNHVSVLTCWPLKLTCVKCDFTHSVFIFLLRFTPLTVIPLTQRRRWNVGAEDKSSLINGGAFSGSFTSHSHLNSVPEPFFSYTVFFKTRAVWSSLSLSMHKHTSPYLPPVGVRRSAIIVFFNHPHKLQMNLYQFDFPTFLQLFLHAFRWTSRGSASSLTLLELPRGLCQQGFNELKCRTLTQADR